MSRYSTVEITYRGHGEEKGYHMTISGSSHVALAPITTSTHSLRASPRLTLDRPVLCAKSANSNTHRI